MIKRVRDNRDKNGTLELMLINPSRTYLLVYSVQQKQFVEAYEVYKEKYKSAFRTTERTVLNFIEVNQVEVETQVEGLRAINNYIKATNESSSNRR